VEKYGYNFFYSTLLQTLFIDEHYCQVASLCHCEELGSPKWFKGQTFVQQLFLDMVGTVLLDDRKCGSNINRTQAKCYKS